MPPRGTIKRVTIQNTEYLVLHEGDIFPRLHVGNIADKKQLKTLYALYKRMTEVIREFITLDSGYTIIISGHATGHIWLLEASRDNSAKHHWLTKKVTKAVNKMVDYLNRKIDRWVDTGGEV